jgi:transcriptional regulator with XRE-family HTH domain
MATPEQIADAAASLERRVAATIADMRGRRGLGQAELAALLGVPAERIARLESGEAGDAASIALLAEIAHRLDFHVTLGLHDRQQPALTGSEDQAREALGDLTAAATLSTLGAVETLDISPSNDFQPDGIVAMLPDEPDQTFELSEPITVEDPTARKQKDDTFSPGSGDGDSGDGMSS